MIYSLQRQSTAFTNNSAAVDVACSSATAGLLMELSIFGTTAVVNTFGVNRPTAIGTRTTPVALLAENGLDIDPAADIDMAVAWSVAPTLAAADMRTWSSSTSIGAGVQFTWPKGLLIKSSTSILVVNRAANGALAVHCIVDR